MTTPPTTVSAVLLVDQRIQGYETIVSSVKPDIRCIVFDVEDKSHPSMIDYIKAKISDLNIASFDTIGLAQYNEHQSSYQMFGPSSSSATIDNVMISDPTLQTWSYITDLFIWLKTTYAVKHFDMLACALYLDTNWKYIIDNLSTISGVEVRASSNRTGSSILGGDWILESTGVSLKNVYFDETIDNFEGVLDVTGTVVNSFPAATSPFGASGNSEFVWPAGSRFVNNKLYVADTHNNRIQVFDSSLNFITKFGTSASDVTGNLNAPLDVAVHPTSGRIHIVSAHRIDVFDSSFTFLFKVGSVNSTSNGYFSYARAVAVDAAGNIYGSDGFRIQKFNSSGVYQSTIITAGTGDGQVSNAAGFDFDSNGNFWVCDDGNTNSTNNRIQKYDSNFNFLLKFGTYGTENGNFKSPCAVAFDSSNNVYIADNKNHRVQKFDNSGNYISQFGSYGTGNGQLNMPQGIAVDPIGNIFVVENHNHRVQKFNSSGTYQAKISALITASGSANGSFNTPGDVAMFPSNGNVYVVDTVNNRIQKFNSSLTWVWSVGSTGSGNSQFNTPRRIAIDASENIYITDAANHCVKKFDSSGSFLLKFGTNGSGTGQFTTPYGIAVDSAFNVFVTDNNLRVQKFGSDGTYITSYSIFNSRAIALDSAGNMYITSTNWNIYKYSSSGTLLMTLTSQGVTPTGISVDPVTSNFAVVFESSQICKIYNSSGTLQVSTSFNTTMNGPQGVYYYNTTLFYTDTYYHGIKKVALTGFVVAPTYTFTESKPQSITKTFGDATFSLSALLTGVSNSSGAYTFATSNSSAISIGGDGVTATVAGYSASAVTITATQAASGDYSGGSTTLSITVARKAPTYGTFTPPTKIFGDASFSMVSYAPTSDSSGAYTYTSSAPGVATISSDGTVVTIVSAGSTTITVSQDICGNYAAGSKTGVLTVNGVTPTYNPASPSVSVTKTYGVDVSFSLTSLMAGISNSSGAYTFSSASGAVSISGTVATILAYTPSAISITASQDASGNYAASSTTVSLLVGRGTPSYQSVSQVTKTYGVDASFSLTAVMSGISSSSGAYSFSSDSAAIDICGGVATINAYTPSAITITASQDASGNYSASSTSFSVLVGRGTPTYQSVSQISKTYGIDVSFSLASAVAGISNSDGEYTFSSGSGAVSISGDVVTILAYTPSAASITATQAAAGNYASSSTTLSLLVGRATPTYQSVAQITKTFGVDVSFSLASVVAGISNSDGAYSLFSSASDAVSISGDVLTILAYTPSAISITASQDASGNYASSSKTLSLLVNRGSPTYQSVSQVTKTYGTDVSFSLTAVMAGVSNSSGAYTFSSLSGAISISGAVVTINAYTPSAVSITASQDASGNYASSSTTVSLLVDRKVPSYGTFTLPAVTFEDASYSLVSSAPTSESNAAYSYASSNTAVATVNSDGTVVTVIGQGYTTITASQDASGNYAAGSTTASLLVNRAAPTFLKAFTITDKTFGDASFSLLPFTVGLDNTDGTYHFSSSNASVVSISEADGVTASILAYSATPVTIYVAIDACGNYAASSTSGTLTINRKVPAYQSVSTVSKTFGDAAFSLTPYMSGISESSGSYTFASSDVSAVSIGGDGVTATILAYTASAITITATQAASGNYAAGTKTFSLTVARTAPTIGALTLGELNGYYDVSDGYFTLTAPTSNSSGGFTYASDNTSVATISGPSYSSANLLVRYDPSDSSNYTMENGSISLLTDLTGNNRLLRQNGTGTNVVTVGSKNMLNCSNVNTGFYANLPLTFNNTFFMVIRYNPDSISMPDYGTFAQHGNRDSDWSILKKPGSDNTFIFRSGYDDNNVGLDLTPNTSYILVSRSGNPNGRYREFWAYSENGTSSYAYAYPNLTIMNGTKYMYIGNSSSNNSCRGYIGEMMYYNATISDSDISNNLMYLQAKWFNASSSTKIVRFIGSGTANISATQDICGNYSTGSVSSLLRVGATVPTFGTFTVSSTVKTYGDGAFTITPPTSNSNGAFTITSSNSSIVSISGTTATIVSGGTVDITVSQDPSGSFTRKSVTSSFTVQTKTPNLRNFADIILSYADGSFTVTAPDTDGPGTFTYSSANTGIAINSSGNALFSINGGGSTTITATQAGSQNYAGSSITAAVTITPILPTASYSNFSRAFDVGTFTIPAPTKNSSGAVSYVSSDTSVATISGTTVTIRKAGETTITATIAATSTYLTRDISAVFTVTRGTPTISGLSNQTLTMTQAPFTLSPTSSSNGTFSYVSDNSAVVFMTNSGTTFNVASVGTATITATITQDTSANYDSRNYGFTMTVIRATSNLSSATFTVPNAMTYGDTPVNIITAPTSDSSGAITYITANSSKATIDLTTGVITAVGEGYVNFIASQAQTAVHDSSIRYSNNIYIARKTITQTRVAPYTSSTLTKYYGDASFQLVSSSESTGSVVFSLSNSSVVSMSSSSKTANITITNVGSVTVTAQQFANSQYATQNDLTWTITVEKGTTSLTGLAATLSKNVTDAPFTVAVTSASTGTKSYALSNPDSSNVLVVNSSTGVVTLKGAGTATIVATQAASSLYNAPSSVSCVVTVAAAGSALQGATITSARVFDNVDMTGASLSGTTVTGVSFAGATMTNAVLTGSTVRNATLTSTNLAGATLSNADVSGTSFAGATMTSVTMTSATLTNSTLTSTDLSGATMTNAIITGTSFASSTMTNAVLTGATLTNSTLTSTVLTGASLARANVSGSTFVGASLAGADLSGATVTNANFTNANISGANITNVAFSPLQKIQLLKNTNNRAIGGIQVGDISGSTVLSAISDTSPAVSIPNIATAVIKVVIPTTSTVLSDPLPNVTLDTTNSDKFYFPINEGEYFQILGVKYYTSSGIVKNAVTDETVEVIPYGNKSIWLIAGSIIANVLAVNTLSASTFTVPSTKLDTDAPFNITVAPTSNSDAAIVYSSNHPSVATIHPTTGLITIIKQGYVSFIATQAATLIYEAGSKTSNELFVNKLINFTLSGLNQTILMSTSGLFDSSGTSLESTDATAVFYVKVSDLTNVFKIQTDSNDMSDTDASDVKYYVFNRMWPAALKINPAHAMLNKNESNGMLGTTDLFSENKMLAKHDFLRYLSLKLFNTIYGVDLFSNESDLLENTTYWGENVNANIHDIMAGISTTSSDETMSYDASGNKYLTNAASGNTNLCRELVRQLTASAASRFSSIVDANSPQGIPLMEDDSINFKVTFQSAPSQNMLTGVEIIPSRSYMVKLVLKNSITGLNTPVIDSEMYPNAYPYSSSVVSYAPTSASSAVYNSYSPPAPVPFARFGFDGWYYTNSTAWVTAGYRNHIKWLMPANSGSSTVGSLLYIRVNLKIHNKVALPYIMVYTQSNSMRKYLVTNTGALVNGTTYSFYANLNSYTREPAMIGYTNAVMSYNSTTGSFADNEYILNVALETEIGAASGTVDFTLASIVIGDANGEKEYGFEAAVPAAYP